MDLLPAANRRLYPAAGNRRLGQGRIKISPRAQRASRRYLALANAAPEPANAPLYKVFFGTNRKPISPNDIAFWTKIGAAGVALTSEQEKAWQAHEVYAARLLAAKLVDLTTTSPPESGYRSSSLVVLAADRAAVEALVREDPAVKSGLLNYEVIQAAE